ncbi:MAG: AAA family ATPase [Parcubacteria group bacterium]|nr:AAA family ATPase [Parcubacteria group bacterium]
MYLKKLELSGFKSFAKKTTLDFPKGVTVVVGPNGSGKSNVVDAIRWALAEQGFKNLRGKKGDDLIFFGSAGRNSLARASVAMHFDLDEKADTDFGFSEAVIERAVDKSGDNSYVLNGRKVRLLDLEEFLAKSRVGDSSFRIISQGLSDKLLNLSPKEFKAFVEEAAGVKEYQDKKHQASLRLKNTRENLDKVSAILAELKPQLRILKKEKDKLEKKEEYNAELKTAASKFFGLRHHGLLAWENKISEKNKEARQIIKPLAKEVENLRTEIFSWDKKSAWDKELGVLTAESRRLESEENKITQGIISAEGKINLEEDREKQKLPVSAEYLKGKIGDIVNKLNIDFKGADIETLRHLMAGAVTALRDLLKVMEHGLNPALGGDTVPLLKQGLEKLLTTRKEIQKKHHEVALARTNLEKKFMEERRVSLARERTYREKESEFHRWEDTLRQVELEEEKLKLHQARFQQDLAAVGAVTLAEIMAFNEPTAVKASLALSVAGQTETALEERVWKLKKQLEEVGSIDDKVVLEFEAVNERYNFLSKESNDLTQTLASLENLVKGLDKEVGVRYKATLAEMSHVFGGYFRLIFGGGRASLAAASNAVKSDNEEIGDEDGVEIKLELPGKKVKNLSTLSGGERTLTSIALLFSLASIRKPPVMVLDEIDAALDETNTAKFIRLVKELSRETQFIIITHNRETMRHADALYGVSMKDGISHLLSLKLQSA